MPHKVLGEAAIIVRGTDFSSVYGNARNRAHAAIFLTYVDRIRNLATDWPGDGMRTRARRSPLPVSTSSSIRRCSALSILYDRVLNSPFADAPSIRSRLSFP